jgi:uncharacterized protein YndB with AHSA1/START domain
MTSLRLVRRIRARPQIVFDAVTTAEGIAQWWGPDAGPVLAAEVDPRVGGRYRVRFLRMLDSTEYESSGEFLEIVRPELVVMSWRWRDGVPDPGESRVQFTLKAIPEGTELTFIHSQLPDEEARLSHEAGWAGAFDKLEALFATGNRGVILCDSGIVNPTAG